MKDINSIYQEFRSSIIKQLYNRIIKEKGTILFNNNPNYPKYINIKFNNLRTYDETFCAVIPISLTATKEKKNVVIFKYIVPKWKEETSHYVEYGEDSKTEEESLETFSADELFNIIYAIE